MIDSSASGLLNWHVNRRSLRLFRVMLGFTMLSNLFFQKILLFKYFFHPEHSVFGTKEVFPQLEFRSFSVLDHCHDFWQFYLVLGLTIASVVLFIIGRKQRIVSALTFFVWWNLCQFQSQFLNPSDFLIGVLLFISIFLPDPQYEEGGASKNNDSWAVKLLVFQVLMVYLIPFLLRLSPEYLNGNVLSYLISDSLLLRNASIFGNLDGSILKLLSWIALVLYGSIVFGLLFYGRKKSIAWLALLGIVLHGAITAVVFNSGDWFLISMTMAVLFIPTSFWTKSDLPANTEVERFPQSIFLRIAIAVLFLLIAQQNVYSLLSEGEPVSKVLQKLKVKKIMKYTYLPRLEYASFLNQDWTNLNRKSDDRIGDFLLYEGDNPNDLFESKRKNTLFNNYTAIGWSQIRSNMYERQMDGFFHDYISAWEHLLSAENELKLSYQNGENQEILSERYESFWHAQFTPPIYRYEYTGPISEIKQGYGSKGSYAYDTYQKEFEGNNIMVFVPRRAIPVPVILFTHAFYGYDYRIYKSLMEHAASWGYAFAFVPYRNGKLSKNYEENILRFQDVWTGFQDVIYSLSDIIDSNNVVVAGHSFGGGVAGSMTTKVFVEKQWGKESGGVILYSPGYMLDLEQEHLQQLPEHLYLQTQVYKIDTVTSAGMAWDYYENANIPNNQKIMLELIGDQVEGYDYLANHFVPAQVGPNIFFDAYDYYGVLRPLDAFLKTVFEKDSVAEEYLFGEQKLVANMGTQLKPMKIMDLYYPLQNESWYWAPCKDPANTRSSFCPQ